MEILKLIKIFYVSIIKTRILYKGLQMYRLLAILCIISSIAIARPQQQQVQRNQADFSIKRTACLILSRYHSSSQKESIESIVMELELTLQQKYIDKMYAVAIQYCIPKITADEAKKFFTDDPQFNPKQLVHIFAGFEYTDRITDLNKLTPDQQSLIKFIKQFDEEMHIKRQQQQATQKQDVNQYEMQLFGFSVSDIPGFAKFIYLLIFVVIIGFIVTYGLNKIDSTNKVNPKKKRRENIPKKNNISKKNQ